MKINRKFLIIMVIFFVVTLLRMPNISNAALQSNGGTPTTKNLENWMLQIRQMQELGGTLGRTDTINTTDLTSEATDLDIHMEKNTEYGAMAILSASAYGNPNKINDGETTTGNSTGIVVNFNNEWTAATVYVIFSGYSSRYIDIYNGSYSAKIGDAIGETSGWHGGSKTWGSINAACGIVRNNGGIFGYIAQYDTLWWKKFSAPGNKYYSRAAIVVGDDL